MKEMHVVENGKVVRTMNSDETHPLGLHECVNCCNDIDEDFDYNCNAYPIPVDYYGNDVHHNVNGYLCERCYKKYLEEKNYHI